MIKINYSMMSTNMFFFCEFQDDSSEVPAFTRNNFSILPLYVILLKHFWEIFNVLLAFQFPYF
jgi:hypothetical protein